MGFFYSLTDERPRVNSLQIQTASFGNAIPIVFGTGRVPGNIIDSFDLREITNLQFGKGGFSLAGQEKTGDRYYSIFVEIALSEGQITSVGQIWADKQKGNAIVTNYSFGVPISTQSVTFEDQFKFSRLYNTPLGYTQTYHPERALSYKGISRMAGEARLVNGKIPNISFEVVGLRCYDISKGIYDANPKDVISDILTDPGFGAGFPSQYLGDLTDYSNYCIASGLFISPVMNAQEECHTWITKILQATNSEVVWSQGKLKFVPYGDQEITGNSITYTPNLTPIYDLTDDDFLDKANPVTCSRSMTADAFNTVRVQFMNRANGYNTEIAEAKDQANIELLGLRAQSGQISLNEQPSPTNFDFIADQNVARTVAQLILQRTLYIRNTYKFRVGWKYCLLEPMDIITINDPGMGLVSQPVRIKSIEEDETGSIEIEVEEFLQGVAHTPQYPTQEASRATVNYNSPAGSVNSPVILEPDMALTNGQFQLWMAISGQYDTWGGANVYFSEDGLTYNKIGVQNGRAKHGILTTLVPSTTADPDIDDVIGVNLFESQGELSMVSQADADKYRSLCYMDGVNGELFSYRDAVLTATGQYNLKYLRRGLYNTTKSQHPINGKFARLDDNIFKYQFSSDLVGKTVYFKFPSFNIWGGSIQSLADCQVYQYKVTGKGLLSPLPNITGLTSYVSNDQTFIQWNTITDSRDFVYEIRKGATFSTAQIVATTKINNFQAVGDGTYWVTAKYLTAYSTTPVQVNLTGTVITSNIFYSVDERDTGWTGQTSGGAELSEYGGQDVIRLLGTLGTFDAIPILDQVPVLDSVNIQVASSGTYEIPPSHIPDLGNAQYGFLYADATMTMDSLNALFSEVPLVSALANLAGNYSQYGAAQIEFALSADGVNYGNWESFVNGKYYFKKPKFRVKLYSFDSTVTAILNDFNFKVDLPPRSFTGTGVTVPTSSLSVTFSLPFHVNPNTLITVLDKQAGDVEYFSVAPSTTGFRFAVLNAGSPVQRTINYSATGY